MIKAKNLVKKFKNGNAELTVLKDLSFEIEQGQFVAITGRSGSGKSTLLYQLSLLDTPTSGEIYYGKDEVSKLNSKQRTAFRLLNLGYVFQDYALIPTLSATENVMVPLLMQGLSIQEAQKKAHDALDRVGLSDRYDNLPSMLSGGQQQRVSIARAIGHNPKILYADEPTANLDMETSEMVLETFITLNSQGQTIVMVTHEPEFAERTHRTIILSDGVITKDKLNHR